MPGMIITNPDGTAVYFTQNAPAGYTGSPITATSGHLRNGNIPSTISNKRQVAFAWLDEATGSVIINELEYAAGDILPAWSDLGNFFQHPEISFNLNGATGIEMYYVNA